MAQFKIGDVVQLKSGSPKMTVTDIRRNDNLTYCTWFIDTANKEGAFPEDALKSAEL